MLQFFSGDLKDPTTSLNAFRDMKIAMRIISYTGSGELHQVVNPLN
jgi:hypothetical protein